jgi:hypothetical protein
MRKGCFGSGGWLAVSVVIVAAILSTSAVAGQCPAGGCRAEIVSWQFGNGPAQTDNLHLNASNIGSLTINWIVYSGCKSLGGARFVIDGAAGNFNTLDKSYGQYSQHIDAVPPDDNEGNREHRSPLKLASDFLLKHPCKHTLQLWSVPTIDSDPLCAAPTSLTPVLSNEVTFWIDSPSNGSDPVDPFPGNPKTQSTCSNGPSEAPTVGCPVDVASGKMFHEMVDLRIDGPLPIEFIRRYDSNYSNYSSVLGNGWQHNGLMHLQGLASNINDKIAEMTQVLVDAQMRRTTFTNRSIKY